MRTDAQRVEDMIGAARLASRLVAEGRQAFRDDWKNVLVGERLVHIVGEAATKLSDFHAAQFPAVPWKEIRRMRIVVTHEYHKVEADIIWATLQDSVPELLAALQAGTPQAP